MAMTMTRTRYLSGAESKLQEIRWGFQHLSFLVLIYGGRFGIHLGSAVPCFACPFVPGCGGYCYLMGLQGYIGFGMRTLSTPALWAAFGWMVVFVILVAVFGKAWCGWACPFGLIQDWLSAIRKKLGVRERIVSPAAQKHLTRLRYALLLYLVFTPPLVTAGVLPEDFYLAFCNICPGKALLPLFVGETKYLGLNPDNAVTLGLSFTLLFITGGTLVGMFFKERFFCLLCPFLTLIHLLKPLTALGLVKTPNACTGCGSCAHACPMDIEALEEDRADVQHDTCIQCCQCMKACPSHDALNLDFFGVRIVSSSKGGA
ncbi:MAG: 4Fe-4S binding protein [Candidatus Accumulibacter sp.]|jgi:polyferredoxin|nr:4Fe-4S binding protein [Accumulibacter sp.]